MFDNGVLKYIKATATVEVYFPIDLRGTPRVCCKHCKYFGGSDSRNYCKLNGELVFFPDNYIGDKCPLKFDEEI